MNLLEFAPRLGPGTVLLSDYFGLLEHYPEYKKKLKLYVCDELIKLLSGTARHIAMMIVDAAKKSHDDCLQKIIDSFLSWCLRCLHVSRSNMN